VRCRDNADEMHSILIMFLKVIFRIHEDLENFKKEPALVRNHANLFLRTGSHSSRRYCQP
jgi:hypothetical protein